MSKLKAEEARELADEVSVMYWMADARTEQTVDEILSSVRRYAAQGYYALVITRILPLEVQEALSELGYKITTKRKSDAEMTSSLELWREETGISW